MPEDFDTLVKNGGALRVPGTIRDYVTNMASDAGELFYFAISFGDLSHEEVMHSAGIFAREVLPASRKVWPRRLSDGERCQCYKAARWSFS